MEPIRLPQPAELQPGTVWPLGPNLSLELRNGKHNGGDLKLVISGNGAPTHEGVFILLLALMQAEERYRRNDPKKKGADYFVTHLGTVVHWWRAHERPGEHYAYAVVSRDGRDLVPNEWGP